MEENVSKVHRHRFSFVLPQPLDLFVLGGRQDEIAQKLKAQETTLEEKHLIRQKRLFVIINFPLFFLFGCFFLFDVNVAWHAYRAKIGALGSSGSLALRSGSFIFSVSSLLFMCFRIPFYGYTAFCFSVTVMGLVMMWSLILATMDACAVLIKVPTRLPGMIALVVLGDWVLSFLSLAASCSTASAVDYLIHSSSTFCQGNLCTRFQLSATMAFFAWFLTFASSLFNLWLLPKIFAE